MAAIPLNNTIVDKRLENRNLKRLGNYINSYTKIEFQCLDCEYIWNSPPNRILNGHNCPRCGGKLKLTNEIMDNRLSNRNISRIDNCIDIKTKITFRCLQCTYEWKASPLNISNGTGCPRCARKMKLSNEIIDERLKDRGIKRIENYISNKIKITFQCLIDDCKYVWQTRPSSILSGFGCPKCSIGKNEKLIGSILQSEGIDYQEQKPIKHFNNIENKSIIIDYYIPNSNIIIEYNGEQHYQPVCFGGDQKRAEEKFVKQQKRDQYLQQFCFDNNIKLIWIDGRKYINYKLKNFMIDEIIPLLKNK